MIILHVKITFQTIVIHCLWIFYIARKDCSLYNEHNNTCVLGNTRFISRVKHDISLFGCSHSWDITLNTTTRSKSGISAQISHVKIIAFQTIIIHCLWIFYLPRKTVIYLINRTIHVWLEIQLSCICIHCCFTDCKKPLGLENDGIKDSQLSADSYKSYMWISRLSGTYNMKAKHGRLNNKLAWCGYADSYFQVNILVSISGRFSKLSSHVCFDYS